MIDIVMAAQKLLTTMRHLDRSVDSCTPQEIADIIKFHSKGAAAAGVAAGWVPGAGGAAATAIAAGFIWTMYGRINSKIGLTFSKSILKTLASGIATNLAGALVSTLVVNAVFSFFPGLGSGVAAVIAGGVCYALTLASGIVYLKILTNIFSAGVDPTSVDIDTLKNMAKDIAGDINMKEIYEEAKEEVKNNRDETVSADYTDYEMDESEYSAPQYNPLVPALPTGEKHKSIGGFVFVSNLYTDIINIKLLMNKHGDDVPDNKKKREQLAGLVYNWLRGWNNESRVSFKIASDYVYALLRRWYYSYETMQFDAADIFYSARFGKLKVRLALYLLEGFFRENHNAFIETFCKKAAELFPDRSVSTDAWLLLNIHWLEKDLTSQMQPLPEAFDDFTFYMKAYEYSQLDNGSILIKDGWTYEQIDAIPGALEEAGNVCVAAIDQLFKAATELLQNRTMSFLKEHLSEMEQAFENPFGSTASESVAPSTTPIIALPERPATTNNDSGVAAAQDTVGNAVQATPVTQSVAATVISVSAPTTGSEEEEIDYVEIARDITEAMTIGEIRALLEEHGLDSSGLKKNLIGRLARALEDGKIKIA
ncbi:hypothetical protein ACFGOO_04890 [Treponema vincentii]|uniref:SAP domain-containing protein n=1 Tax=Treponema vincentii TaxID=69710 RepID=UPI0035F581C5